MTNQLRELLEVIADALEDNNVSTAQMIVKTALAAAPKAAAAPEGVSVEIADKARRALWSLLQLETEPAGFQAAIVKDREKFSGFMKGVNGRIEDAVKQGTEAHDALLAAIEAAPAASLREQEIPEGYKLVPIKPSIDKLITIRGLLEDLEREWYQSGYDDAQRQGWNAGNAAPGDFSEDIAALSAHGGWPPAPQEGGEK